MDFYFLFYYAFEFGKFFEALPLQSYALDPPNFTQNSA